VVPRAESRAWGQEALAEADVLVDYCANGREGKRKRSPGRRVLYPRDVMVTIIDDGNDALRWAIEERDAIAAWLESLDQETPL
jgi:hypothetical protein